MPGPGSLAVTELPARDSRGRRVAVQRITGSGPIHTGDAFLVLVDVPRALANGRRMVDVVTAGTIECVTPSRGQTRGTWTMRRDGAEDKTAQTTRNDAALALAGWVPTAEEAAALVKAAQLAGRAAHERAAAGLDRTAQAIDRLRAKLAEDADTATAVDELAGAFLAALDRAECAEHIGDAQTEWAARLEADRIAEALDALGACPCQLPREHPRGLAFCTEHGAAGTPAAGPTPGSFHDPRVPCCGRDAAACDCPEDVPDVLVQAAAVLDTDGLRLTAARLRHEIAEEVHAAADARVLAARAELEAATEARRVARDQLADAAEAHARLFGLE